MSLADAFEQIHVIKRDGKHTYRCAYDVFGYELGDAPQRIFSTPEDAIENLAGYLAENRVRFHKEEAEEKWRNRVARTMETKDRLYVDLDMFSLLAEKIGSAPKKYRLLDSEGALVKAAAEYVNQEELIPFDEREVFPDLRSLDLVQYRVAQLAKENPQTISKRDAYAFARGTKYVRDLKFTYKDSSNDS